jgi:truncated hemoglobin YjbI
VFGGPADYAERLGGYERMLSRHLGLGITPEQRFRFATLMSHAGDDAGGRARTGTAVGLGRSVALHLTDRSSKGGSRGPRDRGV